MQEESILKKVYDVGFSDEVGALEITNLRIRWKDSTPESTIKFDIPYVNIKKLRLNKSHDEKNLICIVLEDNSPDAVFELKRRIANEGGLGPSRRSELEQLKTTIKDTQKVAASSIIVPTTASSSSSSKTGMDLEKQKRNELLEADPSLAAQYREQVLQEQIMSEEDFWRLKKDALADKEGNDRSSQRGALNSLFNDVEPEYDDKGQIKKITLTVEQMHAIFQMYPAVGVAYKEQVPERMTPKVFWEKYYKSEYFNSKKGSFRNMTGTNLSDDLFQHYELQVSNARNTSNSNNDGTSTDAGANKTCKTPTSINELNSKVAASVDLSAIDGDKEVTHKEREELEEDLVRIDAIMGKYNRSSTLLIDKIRERATGTVTGSAFGTASDANMKTRNKHEEDDEDSMKELNEPVAPDVVPLKLKRHAAQVGSTVFMNHDDEDGGNTSGFGVPQRQQNSAFGKKAKNSYETVSLKGQALTVEGIMSQMDAALDSNDFTLNCYKKDLEMLVNQNKLRPIIESSENDYGSNGNSHGNVTISLLDDDPPRSKYGIPPQFQSYIHERYATITQMLQCLYSHMNGMSSTQTTKRNDTINKIKKIINSLEKIKINLDRDKNSLESDGQYDIKLQVKCLADATGLIDRAERLWRDMCVQYNIG